MELLTWMRANTGMQPKTIQPASAAASPVASDALTKGRRRHAADLLAAAENAFPEVCNGGKIPTLRAIQSALSVGQPKAHEVQKHLAQLQTKAAQPWPWRGWSMSDMTPQGEVCQYNAQYTRDGVPATRVTPLGHGRAGACV